MAEGTGVGELKKKTFVLTDAKGSVILANCECPGKGREDRAAADHEVNAVQAGTAEMEAEWKERLSHGEGCSCCNM